METIKILPTSLLSCQVWVPANPSDPCRVTVPEIDVQVSVRIVWILPLGCQFTASGVAGLGGPDFEDGRFDGPGRRAFRWTARRPGSQKWLDYSLSFEYVDPSGVLQSCVVPNLKIINRS
jgi:hypothetical protein